MGVTTNGNLKETCKIKLLLTSINSFLHTYARGLEKKHLMEKMQGLS